MAKVTCNLNIEISSSPGQNARGWLMADDERLRTKVESLGYNFESRTSGTKECYFCSISEPLDSSKIESIREAVINAGFHESKTSIIPKEQRHTHFAFKYIRNFTKSEVDKAPYLVWGPKDMIRIADWSETTENGYVLKTNKRLKNNLLVGWLDIIIVPYVSEEGKLKISNCGLNAIKFEPATFDRPEKAARMLHRLTSSVTLPKSLTPVKNGDGHIVSLDDRAGEHVWDDEGYTPPLLKYRRSEIASLAAFDIAMTAERLGGNPNHYKPSYIVTQKFRNQLELMKVRGLSFIPIELV